MGQQGWTILATLGLVLFVGSSVMAEYEHNFETADGLAVEGVELVREFPPVPFKPGVRISWNAPDYYVVDGKPSGYGHFGALERLPNGHLMALYQEQSTGSHGPDDPTRRDVCRVSTDGGYTWSESREVGKDAMLHLGVCALKDGTIWAAPVVSREGQRYIPRSTDEGTTWEATIPAPSFFRSTIQMSNGEILGCASATDENGRRCRAVWITDPQGSKWERVLLGEQSGYQTDEWWITETGTPGLIYALMRDQSQGNYYSQAWSPDYGRTWQGYSTSRVWHSPRPSRPSVHTLPDGTLVAVHAERGHGRMIAVPSFDNGKTWSRDASIIVLDGRDGWLVGSHGYGDAALTDEGLMMVSWYAGASGEKDPESGGRGFYGSHIDPRYFKRPCKNLRLATVGDPEDPRLIGRWSFDRQVPTVAYDSVNGNYGRAYRVGRTAGNIGGGLLFNGTDSKVEIPDTPEMRVPNFFSIECFFRAQDVQRPQALISKRPYYYLGIAEGKLNFQVGNPADESMSTKRLDSETMLEAGRWYHAASVLGISYNGYKYAWLYLDGEEVAIIDLSHSDFGNYTFKGAKGAYYVDMRPDGGPMYYGYWHSQGYHVHPSTNLHLGMDNSTFEDVFAGELDEVSLYGRRLFPDEVAALAKRNYPMHKSGLVMSPVITRPPDGNWGQFRADSEQPEGTVIKFVILDATGKQLLKTVSDGDTLADITADQIRLAARLTTNDPARSPVLKRWAVSGGTEQ